MKLYKELTSSTKNLQNYPGPLIWIDGMSATVVRNVAKFGTPEQFVSLYQNYLTAPDSIKLRYLILAAYQRKLEEDEAAQQRLDDAGQVAKKPRLTAAKPAKPAKPEKPENYNHLSINPNKTKSGGKRTRRLRKTKSRRTTKNRKKTRKTKRRPKSLKK